MRLAFRILIAALAASGCSEAEPGSGSVEVSDSAGVRIVVNHPGTLPEWSISTGPVLELGAVDGGPEELFQVAGATRLSNGRLAVLNAGTSEVRFFDENGSFLSSVGGMGQGPGEFRFPYPLFRLAGDSLAIWDSGPGRLSVFTPSGTYVRSVSPGTLNPTPLALLRDGRMVLMSDQFTIPDGPGFLTTYTEFSLVGPDGELISQLPPQPLGEFGRYGDTGLTGTPLFGSMTRRVGGDSSGYWVGTTERPEIRRYSAAGELELVVRWLDGEDRTVTEADAERALAEELEDVSEEERVRIRQIHAARPIAEEFPAHGDIHVDQLGSLWVQKYERPGYEGPSRWLVFSKDGVLRATASLPSGHNIFEIGADYVLAVGQDQFGVEYVRSFVLERSVE